MNNQIEFLERKIGDKYMEIFKKKGWVLRMQKAVKNRYVVTDEGFDSDRTSYWALIGEDVYKIRLVELHEFELTVNGKNAERYGSLPMAVNSIVRIK